MRLQPQIGYLARYTIQTVIQSSRVFLHAQSDSQHTRIDITWYSFTAISFALLNEVAALRFGGIERFLGLFCINLWKVSRKVDERTDTLEFSRAVFSTLQTKSIHGQEVPLGSFLAGIFQNPWSIISSLARRSTFCKFSENLEIFFMHTNGDLQIMFHVGQLLTTPEFIWGK